MVVVGHQFTQSRCANRTNHLIQTPSFKEKALRLKPFSYKYLRWLIVPFDSHVNIQFHCAIEVHVFLLA